MNIVGKTGNVADVSSRGGLLIVASALPEIATVAQEEQEAYSWTATTADIDATDTALLVCNTSSTKHLHIQSIYVWADVATEFDVHVPAYGAFTGTAVTAVNLNRMSSKDAEAVAYADETVNTQASLICTLHTNELATDVFGQWLQLDGALILHYHDSVAVDIVSESAAFNASVFGYYHEH